MKKKFRETGFWLSLTGAVLLVIQQLGLAFGFNVNSEVVNSIVSSVCGVMVVLGILIPSNETQINSTETKFDNCDKNDESNEKSEE